MTATAPITQDVLTLPRKLPEGGKVNIVGLTREQIFGLPLDPASRSSDNILFVCGAFIGAAGGALQSASRTLMVRHTTPDQATEAFGLFALGGLACGVCVFTLSVSRRQAHLLLVADQPHDPACRFFAAVLSALHHAGSDGHAHCRGHGALVVQRAPGGLDSGGFHERHSPRN